MPSLQNFDSYRVLRELPSMTPHRLCEAHDSTLERRVVLQTPRDADGDHGGQVRFLDEARALAAASHPHVVTVLEVVEGTPPYAVLETVHGLTLREALRYFRPSRAEALRVVREVVEALMATGTKGLLPVELSLDTIWLDPVPFDAPQPRTAPVKLRDFRLAQEADASRDHVVVLRAVADLLRELLAATGEVVMPRSPVQRLVDDLERAGSYAPPTLPQVEARLRELEVRARRGSGTVKPLLATLFVGLACGAAGAWLVPREPVGTNRSPPATPTAHSGETNPPLAPLPTSLPLAPLPAELLAPALDPPQKEWLHFVSSLPGAARLEAISVELRRRNPKFDGEVRVDWLDQKIDRILGIVVISDNVTDLMPVRALPELVSFAAPGQTSRSGKLEDLTPLLGLRLESLRVGWTRVKDLRPIAGLPLRRLHCGGCRIEDLTPISEMPLEDLEIWANPIRDLTPLKGLKALKRLRLMYTLVTDLSPLSELPIEELSCDEVPVKDWSLLGKLPLKKLALTYNATKHADVLRSIPTLETINGRPAREVLEP